MSPFFFFIVGSTTLNSKEAGPLTGWLRVLIFMVTDYQPTGRCGQFCVWLAAHPWIPKISASLWCATRPPELWKEEFKMALISTSDNIVE